MTARRVACAVVAIALVAFAVAWLSLPQRGSRPCLIKAEIVGLAEAIESFRAELGHGEYPPGSAGDPESVKRFLWKAFPGYRGGLPEEYRRLDAASSLVFWLGGVADRSGAMIGFSADPKNPFATGGGRRIGPFYRFDPARLHADGALLIYLPPNGNLRSEPFVYFCADPHGEYRSAWKRCRPCRDSGTGTWVNPGSFQIFSPGKGGRYGEGVQYPSGADYDLQRRDNVSNFTRGRSLGADIP